MSEQEDRLPTVFLKPGEIHVAFTPCKVVTVLGSCVAVCLHAGRVGAGAICHATLPCRTDLAEKKNPLCFVDYSVVYMLEQLERKGVASKDLVAALIGGADVYPFSSEDGRMSVGHQNISTAQGMLRRFQLRLVRQEVGGTLPYRLQFRPHVGTIDVERIQRAHQEVMI